jgi:hypothetical protein
VSLQVTGELRQNCQKSKKINWKIQRMSYETLEVIGSGSFGVIRKVKRISDGMVRHFFETNDTLIPYRFWHERKSIIEKCLNGKRSN